MSNKYTEDTKTTYSCNICKTSYKTTEKAEKCYDSHGTIVNSKVLEAIYTQGGKIPTKIKIEVDYTEKVKSSSTGQTGATGATGATGQTTKTVKKYVWYTYPSSEDVPTGATGQTGSTGS